MTRCKAHPHATAGVVLTALVTGLVVAVLATGRTQADAAATAARAYGFQLSPHIGNPRTTFTLRFIAPRRADGDDTEYFLTAIGPDECAELFEFSGAVRRGQRVVMRLTPGDDILTPDRTRRRWCRGAYVGIITYDRPLSSRLIAHFSFGVDRAPVSLDP